MSDYLHVEIKLHIYVVLALKSRVWRVLNYIYVDLYFSDGGLACILGLTKTNNQSPVKGLWPQMVVTPGEPKKRGNWIQFLIDQA